MHALLHRALTPQAITSAWLVLTIALTLALAVAQSALASAVAPAPAGPRTEPLAGPHAPAAARGDGARGCRGTATTDDARAAARTATIGFRCRATALRGPAPNLRIPLDPAPSRGAPLLAALYAGAGPNGPPAPRAMPPIPVPAPYPGANLDLDSSLSLPRNAPVATTPGAPPPLMPSTGPTA